MNKKLVISLHQKAISVIFPQGHTYTFDPSGRPVGLFVKGHYFARGLDGRIKEKSWKGASDQFDRCVSEVTEEKAKDLYQQLFHDLREAKKSVFLGQPLQFLHSTSDKDVGDPKKILNLLLAWNIQKLNEDEEKFRMIYRPISILPPDHYFTIPIQVVYGCPWNICTFCHFYRDRRFHIRPKSEVKEHIKKVKSFFGKGGKLRRTVFLLDANALGVPNEILLPVLKEIRQQFPDQMGPQGGIYTFADVPAVIAKTDKELDQLRSGGIRRVYVGMETGSDEIRKLILKPGKKTDVVHAIQILKAAGLEAGIIVLLGLGGKDYGNRHVKETVAAINKMNLGRVDVIFFSPFYPEPNTGYTVSPHTKNLKPLKKSQIRKQFHEIKKNLTFRADNGIPRMGVYDIREFMI